MKQLQIAALTLIFCTSTSLATVIVLDSYETSVIVDYDNSLLVTGGGAGQIIADHSSHIEVQSTTPLQYGIGGIYGMVLSDNSTMNYYGGETGSLSLYNNATAVLKGGSIDYLASFQLLGPTSAPLNGRHIEVICRDYAYNFSTNLLTGTWMDGSSFSIKLEDQAGYARVIDNIRFIPEPATLTLLGLGGLVLRRKKK